MKHIYIILFLLSLWGCNQKRQKPTAKQVVEYQKHLISINQIIVQHIADSIRKLNETKKWGMTQSKTGLWFKMYHVGTGDSARLQNIATISYQVRLLDGKLCYSTDTTGPKNIIIGRSDMESGVEEGLRMMRVGDSAHFILPPHLAHGLVGDQKKIPRMAIISYTIILQGIQKEED